ncbi:MAG: DUF1294 domain-containing protein [Porticoccaceae bacterium]
MRHKGTITRWKDDQGFGFITPNEGGEQVFVHIKSFTNRQRRPAGDEAVTYALKTDAKGRLQAGNVVFVGDRTTGTSLPRLTFAVLFLVLVTVSVLTGKLPFVVLTLYLIASVVAFLAYADDKTAAKKQRWRTQESTLHLFGLIGGWSGALVAQQLFRHKSNKRSFQIQFWITVVANCGALGWWLSPSSSSALGFLHRLI